MAPPPLAIDLRHLRYFLAVSDELHFGRAAERLHIAQPPLSQAIRKLENELGVQLLHRTSRVVVPTEAGKVFAEEARKVLASFDMAVAEARRAAGVSAALRIGSSPHLPLHQLQRLLTMLQGRDGGLVTRVTHLDSPEQRRRLLRGELDVGMFHDLGEVAGLEVEAVFPGEPVAAFLPTGHRLQSKKTIGPENLADEVLVTFPRALNPQLYDRFYGQFEQAGYRFRETVEANSGNERDLLLAVSEGLGLLLGAYSLKDISEAGSLVVRCPLDPPLWAPDTVIAWRGDAPAQLTRVLRTLREVARGLRAEAELAG